MSKHLPSNWQSEGDGVSAVVDGERLMILTVHRFAGLIDAETQDAISELAAAAPELTEACQTFEEWLRREDTGPVFPEGTTRDTPGNEDIWRAWHDENLRLCGLAMERARAALKKAGIE